jgi:colanic acid biosynthesis glycosyl transferase WcaI
MPRVVFVNRYFHPDHSATSQIASDLAFHLASRGWDVAAVTGRQQYDNPAARLSGETVQGVRIVRVWSTRFGRSGLAGRAVDYLTFYLSAFLAILRERGAVIVAMTDPPLISVVCALAGRRLVNWIQDLFPEVASALGIRSPGLLRRMRDWSLRRARRNVVLGELMAARVPNAVVIPNWADAGIRPVPSRENAVRQAWGLDRSFVVGYSGNFGRAHDFDTIIRAIGILGSVPQRDRLPIRFVFIGGGAKLEEVQSATGPLAMFLPYQPRHMLADSLSAADVHLVTLEPALEGLIVPSKFYGVIAAGRPVIFIGSPEGELAGIIRRSGCGVVVASGDAEGLARTVRELAEDPERVSEMSERGLRLHRETYAREHAFAAWEQVLREAV